MGEKTAIERVRMFWDTTYYLGCELTILSSCAIHSTLYSQVFLKYFQVTELVQLLEDQRRKAVIMQRCKFYVICTLTS